MTEITEYAVRYRRKPFGSEEATLEISQIYERRHMARILLSAFSGAGNPELVQRTVIATEWEPAK